MVTTRSISAMPYLGGTISTAVGANAMARLTPSRMAWFYQQTNPSWLIGSLVDTTGGYVNGGTPVMTTQQLLQQGNMAYSNNWACRLNDTTVLLLGSNGQSFSYSVYEIDSNNQFNLTAQGGATPTGATGGVLGSGVRTPTAAGWSQGLNTMVPAELADNLVMVMSSWSGYALTCKIAYNTSTKALTFDTAWSCPGALGFGGSYNVVARKIPQTTMTMFTFKYGSNWYAAQGFDAFVYNADGSLQMSNSQLPNAFSGSVDYRMDLIPLSATRIAACNSNSATFWNVDYNAKTYTIASNGQFTTSWVPGAAGYTMLPLTADYFAMINRNVLYAPVLNGLKCKVVRRVDFNVIEQSNASSGNGNTGFTVTGTPGTYMNFAYNEPELVNGKIFYWGYDAANAMTKLSWTVISLPTS